LEKSPPDKGMFSTINSRRLQPRITRKVKAINIILEIIIERNTILGDQSLDRDF
jgi:hypothetical protein